MGAWGTMRRFLALGMAAWLGAAAGGCGRDGDERDARRAAETLYAAVAEKQGQTACATLTPAAAHALEQEESEPCARAVTSVRLSGSRASRVRVYESSAAVSFEGGDIAFLDHTDEGWRVSAAGCKPMGQEPADCELED
jgi:hypothetical protein